VDQEWFFQADGSAQGPHSAAELKRFVTAGRIASETLVRKGTNGRWIPAGRVKGLLASSSTASDTPSSVWLGDRSVILTAGVAGAVILALVSVVGVRALVRHRAEADRAEALAALDRIGAQVKIEDGRVWLTCGFSGRRKGAPLHSMKEVLEYGRRLGPIHAVGALGHLPPPKSKKYEEFKWRDPSDGIYFSPVNIRDRDGPLSLDGCGELRDLKIFVTYGKADKDSGKELQNLVNLTHLRLGLSDDQLQYLRPLVNLETLDLSFSGIEGTGLVHLSGCTKLKTLILSNTRLKDAALEHLLSLGSLERLDLSGTGITDEALKHVAKLPRLKELDLEVVRITGRGLSHLQGLTGLRRLDLSGNRSLSDADMQHLTALTGLYQLHVDSIDLGAPGLAILETMPGLQRLHCLNTKLTKQDEDHLQVSRPDIDLWRVPRIGGLLPGEVEFREVRTINVR
jgi:hypothetical protein